MHNIFARHYNRFLCKKKEPFQRYSYYITLQYKGQAFFMPKICVVKRYDPFSLKKEENERYNVFIRLEISRFGCILKIGQQNKKGSKRSPYQMLYRASKRKTVPYNPHFLSADFGRILKRNSPVAFSLSRFKTLLCLGAVLYGSARKIHHCTSRSLLRKYSQSCLRPYYLGTGKADTLWI